MPSLGPTDEHLMAAPAFYRDVHCGSPIETNAAQKVLEPWIGAKRVEAWPLEHARIKSLVVTFFEPTHRFVLVTERGVDHLCSATARAT